MEMLKKKKDIVSPTTCDPSEKQVKQRLMRSAGRSSTVTEQVKDKPDKNSDVKTRKQMFLDAFTSSRVEQSNLKGVYVWHCVRLVLKVAGIYEY